jgi:hypothetical protein
MSEPVPVTNCYVIEKAVKDLICAGNNPQMVFKAVDIQKDLQTITQPSFTVAVIKGDFEPEGMSGKLTESVDVVVTLIVKNLANEEQRRMMIHPMVSYVVQKLHHNDLGLQIEPLTVKGWNDVSSAEHLSIALTLFEIKFNTHFTLVPEAAEHNYRELLSIGTTFKIEGHDYEMIIHGDAVVKEPKVKILELEDGYIFKLENDKFLILENEDS